MYFAVIAVLQAGSKRQYVLRVQSSCAGTSICNFGLSPQCLISNCSLLYVCSCAQECPPADREAYPAANLQLVQVILLVYINRPIGLQHWTSHI